MSNAFRQMPNASNSVIRNPTFKKLFQEKNLRILLYIHRIFTLVFFVMINLEVGLIFTNNLP